MTFRPTRHAVALGVAVLVVGSVTSTFTLLSRPLESTASPALTQPDRPVDAAAAVEPEPAAVSAAVAEPAEAPAPEPVIEEPAPPVAVPAPRPDPARLAGGPVAGRPEPDPSLDGARFRVGEAGFFTSLPQAQRDEYPALAEVWREKGDARGWRMPDYSRVVASASGAGGSRPPKVDYDARFAAALSRVGGGRPGGFGPDILSQIHPQGLVGVTTWYGDDFHGLVMRYGEIYDMYDPTIAACNVYPGGTRLRVTASNGRYVDVTVKDTGAFQYPIVTDLSWAAFAQLGDPDWGVVDVVVEPLDQIPPDVLAAYGPPQAPFKTPPPAGGLVSRAGPAQVAASPSAQASPRAGGTSASPVASPAPALAPRNAVPTPTPPPATATPPPMPTATSEAAVAPTASPTAARTPTRAATPTPAPTATATTAAAPAPVAQPIVPVPIATAAPTRTPTPAPPTATPRPTNTPPPLPTATAEADRPTGAPAPAAQPTAPRPPAAPSPAAPAGNRDGG